ncbi:MAG: hypothetical protein ACO3A2_04080 [Bdellovibrionia bacterium]
MWNTWIKHSGLSLDPQWRRFFFQFLGVSLLLHGLSAILSVGFYHTDEHFQIIEFLNLKLGGTSAAELPIEYSQKMRPWLFPGLLFLLTRVFQFFGISSPFALALGYRSFSSLLGLLSSAALALCCTRWFPRPESLNPKQRERNFNIRTWAVAALGGIWYLPALHARPSSENLASSTFFLALSLITLSLPEEKNPTPPSRSLLWIFGLAGALFGFSFEFRYQVVFMILGALYHLAFITRVNPRLLLALIFGGSLSLILGRWVDFWGYGEFTWTPWNYFNYILVQNHVSDSETSTFWDYFRRALTETFPPLGFLLLLSLPLAWFKNPKHILTLSTAPLFLVHTLIAHKELRFLFPLAPAAPLLLIQSLLPQTSDSHSPKPFLPLSALRSLPTQVAVKFLLFLNILALILTTISPACGPVVFYEKLFDFTQRLDAQELLIHSYPLSFFDAGGVNIHFYHPPKIQIRNLPQAQEFLERVKTQKGPHWLVTPRAQLNLTSNGALYLPELQSYCQAQFSTLPDWTKKFKFFSSLPQVRNFTLYRCESLQVSSDF